MTTFFESNATPSEVLAEVRLLIASLVPASGNGPPANSLGLNGTFYIDRADPTHPVLYGPKANGTWPAGVPLVGPPSSSGYRISLSALRAADIADRISYYGNAFWIWTAGNFNGLVDDVNIVKSDNAALTVGAWKRQTADALSYGRTVNIALPLDKSLPRTLAYMGIDPFTTIAQTGKLNSAFANAAFDNLKLVGHSDGRYTKEGPLPIACDFDGQGCTFLGVGASNALQLSGDGKQWRNFKTLGASSARTSADATDAGVYCTATNFILENFAADRVEAGKGHGAAAIFFAGAKGGYVRNSVAKYSFADGHHLSDGCEDVSFVSPLSVGVGDDGFAVVSYDYQKTINKRIHTKNLRAIDVKARGLSVLGCIGGVHENPYIKRSSAAALYMVSEGADSFNTLGSRFIKVLSIHAEDCVTGVDRPGLVQAVLLISGRDGTVGLNDGTTASLSVSDYFVSGEVLGIGNYASYGMRLDSAANIRGGFDVVLNNISGPNTADACVQIGGQDNYGRIVIDGCDGYPFLFMPSTTGSHSYQTLQGKNTLRKSPAIKEAFHGSATNSWDSIHVDLALFPDANITPAGNMDLNKLSWRRFMVAGNVVAHP